MALSVNVTLKTPSWHCILFSRHLTIPLWGYRVWHQEPGGGHQLMFHVVVFGVRTMIDQRTRFHHFYTQSPTQSLKVFAEGMNKLAF